MQFSAGVQQENSFLTFVKNECYGTTKKEIISTLYCLLLLSLHKDTPIDFDKITDMYASRDTRKMMFMNLLASN